MSSVRHHPTPARETEADLVDNDWPSALFDTAPEDLGRLFRGTQAPQPLRAGDIPSAANESTDLTLATLPLASMEAGGDWAGTLTLVERAAATIRAYEKRFVQMEKQSRSLADRAMEDHQRLQAHINALEVRLKQAEERVVSTEAALRDAEYSEWETDMRAKRAEQRAEEAENRSRQAEAYLRRVHELLSGVS